MNSQINQLMIFLLFCKLSAAQNQHNQLSIQMLTYDWY